MGHIVVFVIILSLAIGTAAINQLLHYNRIYRLPALRYFTIYFILSVVICLFNLVSMYILNNVTPLSSVDVYILIIVIMGTIGFTLAGFELFYLGKSYWKLIDKELPVFVIILYIIFYSSWFISFVSGIIIYFTKNDTVFLLSVHRYIVLTIVIISFFLQLALLFLTKEIKDHKKRQALYIFAIFGLLLSIGSIINSFLPRKSLWLSESIMIMIYNLSIFLFLRWFITRMYGEPAIESEQSAAIENLMIQNGISLREKEIIEMILRGMSNKEIEQKLFISPHTVKNHIYHIFQKLNISSRGQLTNIIHRQSNKPEDGNS